MSPKALAVGSVCVLLACAGTDGGGGGTTEGSPAAMLAGIDLGTNNPPRAAVNAYAGHLDRLQVKCSETRSSLADIILASVLSLGREGIQSTNREFLAAIDGAVPDDLSSRHEYPVDVATGKLYCTEVALALEVMTKAKSPNRSPWFQGGSLNNTTYAGWMRGTDRNKLATAGDWLAATVWTGHLNTPADFDRLKLSARRLVAAVDRVARARETGHLSVNLLAAKLIAASYDFGP